MSTQKQRMTALYFDGTQLHLEKVPIPTPAPGEVLLKVSLAGVCATDLEITRGYMDFTGVLGHEFVGRVVKTGKPLLGGEDDVFRKGQRVAGEINLPCHRCPMCRKGFPNHCYKRTVLGIAGKDGVFARYVTLPATNLYPIPPSVPDEKAVFTEPLAAALRILEQVVIEPSTRVLVVGDGRLGILNAMVLSRMSRHVTLVGRHPNKMALIEPYGVKTMPVSKAGKLRRSFAVTVDASGDPKGWEFALTKLQPRGVLVVKTTTHQSRIWNPAPLVIDEIIVVGSRCGPFDDALEWLEDELIDPTPLITERYTLAEGLKAMDHAARPDALKILIKP
ncbi:MAG: alcohol dehydrogenase catalytic domain-containing protein [Candidatus Eisenbacteria bacterium]|uniref:Alcohol dehydrogenase catalytic domain-containing protein n=1 Tax=Eiseniibacteriota bacterium TaxID=2212470 RepID=A0A948RWR3_UNCEI|nr:alcohol dehydrogenase catalytic domain-containing protein [Candidatus Eisenbacteria bacterium]MBU1950552.1 alcohol dehydrogenase catalytic domain-containing protein [Candidatus Eisenbacteria bacterium]MBU2690962.1 alcohol dehydrogenase catalytic domain-containing protein [Candidatus Eisenbacteria bacterium]